MATRITDEQRKELINKVEALRKSGMSAAAACKEAKVNLNNFNYWMRAGKGAKGKSRLLKAASRKGAGGMKALNVNLVGGGKNQPLVIAIGQPRDVNAALANLAAMFGGRSA